MTKIYSLLYILISGSLFSQTILNQQEGASRTVQDPNVVVLAPGFHATSSLSDPFVAKIGAATENGGGGPTTPSTAGSGNPSGTTSPQGTSFHDTQGNIDVNGGGQLQFTLPIALPPGVRSVAPQINLVYTSGSGNGIAGYGWNISGITAISRVGRNIERDGEVRGVQLDYSDYYSFNGQRLVLKSGEYGKDGAEYVTEKFSNVKIRSVGSIAGQQWKGPEYWEVTFEDGSQAWYGGVSGGSGSARTPMEYNIVKWRDAQGNYITYNYTQSNNVAVISSIQWGGNETLSKAHFNEITFGYIGRIQQETSYLKGVQFMQNRILSNIKSTSNGTQFKKYVITYEIPLVNNDNTQIVGHRFVKSIKEYNSNNEESNEVAFNSDPLATSIEERPFIDFENVLTTGDYNGDGLLDFIVSQPAQNGRPEGYYIYFDAVNNSVPSFVYLGSTSSYFPSSVIYTFNIKPADNIIKPRQGILVAKHITGYVPPETRDIELYYYSIKSDSSVLNTFNNPLVLEYSKIIPAANYEYSPSTYPPLPDPTYNYIGEANRSALQGTKEIDIDSDGLSETILAIQDSKCFNQVIIEDPLKTRWDCRTLGYRYFVIESDDLVNGGIHVITPPLQRNILQQTTIMDFDNDGIQDILFVQKQNTNTNASFYTLEFATNNVVQKTTSTPVNNLYQYSIEKSIGGSYALNLKHEYIIKGYLKELKFADLNGDGNIEVMLPISKSDVNTMYFAGWSIYHNDGNSLSEFLQGFSAYYDNDSDSGTSANSSYGVIDMDGDGKSEFMDFYASHSTVNVNYTNLHLNKISNFQYNSTNPQFKWSYQRQSLFTNIQGGEMMFPIFGDFRVNNSISKILFISKSVSDPANKKIVSYRHYNLNNDKKIKSITQGGITTQIDYKELDPAVNPGFYSPVKSELYPYMEMDKISQSYAVAQIRQSIPMNGATTARKQDFRYRGLTTHLQGRGMIGFRQTARSSWYADGFENTKIWSGAEMDPLNEGVPIREWSIKTNSENQIFPSDLSVNNTQLLSFKQTAYQTDVLPNGVKAIVPMQITTKDFLKDITTINTVTYGNYYLPTQTVSNINGGFAVSTTDLSYIHNPSGTGKDYYIGRPASKNEQMTVYGDSKGVLEEYDYEGNLLKYKTLWNRDMSGLFLETYDYDGFGNITKKEITSSFNYNISKTDKAQYDPQGRFVIKKTDNLNLETHITYNDWGQVLTQTDPFGVTLTNTYDAWGKLLTSNNSLGGTTTYRYNKETNRDAIISEYAPDGGIKISYINTLGQNYMTTTKKYGQGEYASIKTIFDELGRKTKESEPFTNIATQWNTINYDDYSRPIKATAFTGKIVETAYIGRTTTVTETNAYNRSKKQTADALGNIISSEDLGGIISFKYNAAGENIESNYEGNIVKISYDVWGNKSRFEDPSNGVYEYYYTGYMGALSKVKSPKGEKTYEYNNKGQLIKQTEKTNVGNATDKSIQFEYSDKGVLIRKYGSSLGKSYSSGLTYDNYGRILSSYEDSNGKYFIKKGIIYDDKMRVTSYEKSLYSSGILTKVSIENEYDAWSGDLYRVKEKTTGKVLWELQEENAKGQIVTAKLGGTLINNLYTSGFLGSTSHTRSSDNSTVLFMSYGFNLSKNELTSRYRGGYFNITEQFEYDSQNRLINWTDPVTGVFTQNKKRNEYDNKGRIMQNDQVGTIKFENVTTKYRPTGMVLNTLGIDNYDNELLQKISYNENNDPIFIDGMKGDVAFEYGLSNMRQMSTYGGNFEQRAHGKFTKYYSEDGSYEIIINNQNGEEKHLIYVGGSPYESNIVYLKNFGQSSGSFHFLHKDYLGSILAITDESGYAIEQRHYDAWGNFTHLKIAGSNVDPNNVGNYSFLVDRGYTSHEHFAEVGLIHMNGRLYDPLLRRFLNADENIQDPYNTQNYNKYGYVLNNPLMYNDPSGEFLQFLVLAVFWKAVGVGVAVGLASAVLSAGLTGQQISIGGILKSAFIGGISAAVTFGIGSIFSVAGEKGATLFATALEKSIGKVGLAIVQGGTHAISQGVLGMMQGANFLSSAVSAFTSSVGASGWSSVMGTSGVGMIAFGAIVGGVGSALSGGNFWQGAVIGGIVAGLNHGLHRTAANASLKKELIDAGYDPKSVAQYSKEEVYELIQKVRSLSSLYGNADYEAYCGPCAGDYSGKQTDYTVWKNGKSIPDNNSVHTNKISINLTEISFEGGFLSVTPKAFFLSKSSFSSYFNLAKTLGVAYITTINFFNPTFLYIKSTSERTKALMPLANDWLKKVGAY